VIVLPMKDMQQYNYTERKDKQKKDSSSSASNMGRCFWLRVAEVVEVVEDGVVVDGVVVAEDGFVPPPAVVIVSWLDPHGWPCLPKNSLILLKTCTW
jgi:hypothetical protein